MILALLLLVAPALAIARIAGPRTISAFVAISIMSFWALMLVIVDIVGRVRFDETSVLLTLLVLGFLGSCVLWKMRREPIGFGYNHAGCMSMPMWSTRVLVGVWAVIIAWSAMSIWVMPATVPDVVRYHLPQVVSWVRDAKVGIIPELDYRANYFPHAAQAPNALLYLLARTDRVLGMPQLVFSGVLFPVVCFMTLRSCSIPRRNAMFFALASCICGPVIYQMRVEMVDVAHAAALLFGLVVAVDGARHFRRPIIALTLGAALALGTKSTGPLAFGVIGIAAFLGAAFNSRTHDPGSQSLTRRIRTTLSPTQLAAWTSAAIIAVLIGGWVFIISTIEHGNPLYPFYFSIGPITLDGPDKTHAIFHYAWIHDMGVSRIDRLLGGAARWIPMLAGVEPFNNFRGPGLVGAGWVVTITSAFATIGLAVAIFKRRVRSLIPTCAVPVILCMLALYSVLFVMNVSLITAPWSTVDARYQLHLFMIFVIVAARTAHLAPRWAHVLMTWIIVAASIPLSWTLLYHAPHRGIQVYTRMLDRGEDRSWIYERGPFFVSNDMDKLRSYIGDSDNLLLLGQGHVYPLMWPSFERSVLPITTGGADVRVVDRMGVPQDVYAQAVRVLESFGEESKSWMGTREDWFEYRNELARTLHPEAMEYITSLADSNNARWVYTHRGFESGEYPIMRDHPDWELVWFDQGPNDARTMALYRRVDESGETP